MSEGYKLFRYNETKEVLAERGIEFEYDDKLTNHLIKPLKNGKYGARDLRKEIRKNVEDLITNLIIESGDALQKISISAESDQIVFPLIKREPVLY